jgi:hypothetical protein
VPGQAPSALDGARAAMDDVMAGWDAPRPALAGKE